ncbi:reverse transcriptase domain-containing protein [Tanacetum coccineum]|uniref:Reverse transcriptase domain-containing protein n=1 Tax=Tanacetum coccineum TaxID=301880 RepID=A0ABQ4ZLA4_9ASTR
MWRMCIDFKNVNSAYPKDYYPLLEIDLKIESAMGFPYKCFLNAYKGYHQIQMSEEDEEKTAFYIDQGTYSYVDDMVNKSKTEHEMIIDIAKTFDNLRKSSKTLKEMQSLSGKLAALNRFLSRSAERALPFFETLKNITKENKEDYRWTKDAERAFQEMKRLIIELPTPTTPVPKETLCVYLVASKDAVSGVLMADREGKQTPIRFVSRTLHEVERNYAPLKKLALCLLHLSRMLRMYFEVHLISMDQPIKQILNKPEVSGKLAKYAVEIGAYNITYVPRNAVKGQVLVDFINKVPTGTKHLEIYSITPCV